MNREVIPKVKRIINQSMVIAKELDAVKVTPEHITLSILNDNDNKCVDVLNELNVDINKLYDLVYELSTAPKAYTTPRISQTKKLRRAFSNLSKEVFNRVDEQCDKLGDDLIDTRHIMMSIIICDTLTSSVLLDLGVNYKSFKFMIREMRSKEDVENSAYGGSEFEYEGDKSPSKKKVSGKTTTPVLDNFCRDISKAVEEGGIDLVVGRSKEIRRVSQILSRRKKNNPILIGEAGVGKTAIVEGLTQLIHEGKAPINLLDKRIFSLDLASIVAGTKYRGQFEERMKAILEELKDNPDIVLFIDEMHTMVGAGNASGSLDASNILKPALARGEIQVIGATTLDEYRENIEKDGALKRRFQEVLVEEPTIEETITILKNIRDRYEEHHKVKYTDEAIEECVKFADRFIPDRAMPDKAIDILDEAGATTNVNIEAPENIKKLEIKKEELKDKKLEVVNKQNYEDAAKLRDEEKKIIDELEVAKAVWLDTIDKERTVVDTNLIAEVVSMMTGIPVSKISSQESKKLMSLDSELMGKVIGQDDAVGKVVNAIKRSRIGIKDKRKPIGSFIFLGPTGVGKCFTSDTTINIRSKSTNLVEKIDIDEFIDRLKH